MEKKTIIWIGIGAGSVLLLLVGWLGFRLWQGSREAGEAAREFSSLLQEGEMEKLTLNYYAYDVRETEALEDEEGQAQVVLVTPQQMAQRFGSPADALEESGEEPSDETEEMMKILMSYSRVVSYSTGLVWGDRAVMTLTMEGPDIDGWMQGLTDEELVELLASGEAIGELLERKLAAGEVPVRTLRMQIPMVKQDGRWRFRVTQEMEDAFLGAPYPGISAPEALD